MVTHTMQQENLQGEMEDSVVSMTALFAAGALVKGFVRITAPEGRTVAHNGIDARLESNFVAVDDASDRMLAEYAEEIAPPGEVAGTVDVPFTFRGTAEMLHESYEGALFSVRHAVIIIVKRPWFTFEVTSRTPVSVQRVHTIPRRATYVVVGQAAAAAEAQAAGATQVGIMPPSGLEKDGAQGAAKTVTAPSGSAASGAGAGIDSQLSLYTEQRLGIEGLPEGGSVVFVYDKGWYVIDCHEVCIIISYHCLALLAATR